jgi:CPA2 family monovalent cation:H+ antiporter-2
VGAIISVASTMVLSRFLSERGELRSDHGQVMIGITLVEDVQRGPGRIRDHNSHQQIV